MDENLKQKVKNMLPIIIAVIVIIIIIITTLFFTLGRKNDDKIIGLTFDSNKPIPVKQNELYGYISASNGKEIIPAKYITANPFYGDYAITTLKEEGDTKYCVIDKKGKVKLSSLASIKYIAEYGLYIVDNTLYNENFKALTDDTMKISYKGLGYSSYIKYDKDNKPIEGGVLNSNGKKVYSYKFKDSEEFFSCTISETDERLEEEYAKVNVDNNKYAIINLKNGKVVYDYTDKSILVDDDNIFTISSNENQKSIICLAKNKIAYETSDNIELSYYDIDNKILQIYDSSKDYSERYSYYDLKSKKILSEKPSKETTNAIESLTGYKSFSSDSKHGVMKGDKTILSCEFDDIEFLSPTTFNFIKSKTRKELVLAKKDGIYELINLKGKKSIFSFKASNLDSSSQSTFIKAKLTDTREICIYNLLTGKSMNFDSDSQVSVYSNYIIVTKNNTKTYYNTKLNEIYKQ
ncbi:MAG: WG repeat-containing protein [Clostridia bacterium]|nr:WG repeat-containing protein [Clostridia bacterium]